MASSLTFMARPMVAGEASGSAAVLDLGFSFAMAFDVTSGRIRDVYSGQAGRSLTGQILVMPEGRGSSSSSTSLAEAIRLGTAPAAIVLSRRDEILAIGAMVARELYAATCPIVVASPRDHRTIRSGVWVSIAIDGRVEVARSP